MKKTFFAWILIFTVYFIGQSQEYNNAIGLRGGIFSGISFKHFVGQNTAIEGILDSRWHGFQVIGLMEHHNDISDLDGLRWFYGYGGHIGFYDGYYTTWGENTNYTLIGIDGIIGLEYLFKDIPVSISLDWKPYINLTGYTGFGGDGGALSVRYTF